jgi:hypothetical protein
MLDSQTSADHDAEVFDSDKKNDEQAFTGGREPYFINLN